LQEVENSSISVEQIQFYMFLTLFLMFAWLIGIKKALSCH